MRRFLLIAFGIFIFVFWGVFIGSSSEIFPINEEGIFVGTITNPLEPIKGSATFVIDNRTKGELIPMIFVQNTKIVRDKKSTKKLKIEINEKKITIYGNKDSATEYSGKIKEGDKNLGEWKLTKLEIDPTAVKLPQSGLPPSSRMRIAFETENLVDEATDLMDKNDLIVDEIKKLEGLINNESQLKDRSDKMKDVITGEINVLGEEKRKQTSEYKVLIDELATLNRVTNKGRIVDLGRRIAKRENRFLALRWTANEDNSQLEEELAEQYQIELPEFKEKFAKAQEIEKIKRQIEHEQDLIDNINNAGDEEEQVDSPEEQKIEKTPKVVPTRDPEKGQGWWRKVTDVF